MNRRCKVGLCSLEVTPVDATLTYRIAECFRIYRSLHGELKVISSGKSGLLTAKPPSGCGSSTIGILNASAIRICPFTHMIGQTRSSPLCLDTDLLGETPACGPFPIAAGGNRATVSCRGESPVAQVHLGLYPSVSIVELEMENGV
jgi:hypothetical protein